MPNDSSEYKIPDNIYSDTEVVKQPVQPVGSISVEKLFPDTIDRGAEEYGLRAARAIELQALHDELRELLSSGDEITSARIAAVKAFEPTRASGLIRRFFE